jgi:hypothetical protein
MDMDTTRENVERWISEHAKPHITRDYRPTDEARDMLRALVAERDAARNQVNKIILAERDTLKALCVGLADALRRRLIYGGNLEQDDYGVHGSTFDRCPECECESGAGILNKGIAHEPDCSIGKDFALLDRSILK